ncbi:MAG: hypothetical protein LC135_13010 [Phycisphaerae bacterium]|jgi:hypothetical protein|nr:hypothetical protein [Phycisphaerae bacterium]MCZ2400772.1 hypothetical protein [Phycisphaerae bacterium]
MVENVRHVRWIFGTGRGRAGVGLALLICGLAVTSRARAQEGGPPPDGAREAQPAQQRVESTRLEYYEPGEPTYLLSKERWHNDPEILWPGFLTGMRGFEGFYEPIGSPLYFESPFINTNLRFLYLWHKFPSGSNLGGGDLSVFAAQIRLALTDRLAFIATKDGYSLLNAGILPPADGWNDLAIGLKYAFIVDKANDFVLTGGMRWELSNGSQRVLQGGAQELSPFVSFAKGFDRFHMLGNVTYRAPMDRHDAVHIISYDLHFDYEILPEHLPGFAPVLEFHGLHYLSNGDMLPLSVGGLDYTNIGSEHVAGDGVFWAGLGFRWKLSPNASFGSTFEYPLHNPDNDIMGARVTADLMFTY